jgi:hypothetical protein
MLKGFTHARLACGCRIAFREGVEGSPVTVVVEDKGLGCVMSLHVRNLPIYDYREALRPPTRFLPLEEEGPLGGRSCFSPERPGHLAALGIVPVDEVRLVAGRCRVHTP